MPKIIGPTALLSQHLPAGMALPEGTPNPFLDDLLVTLFAHKPTQFSADGDTLTIENIVDYDRISIQKAIGIYQITNGAARVEEYEVMIGVAVDQIDSALPESLAINGLATWHDLAGFVVGIDADEDRNNYNRTGQIIDNVVWMGYGGLDSRGLSSAQLATLVTVAQVVTFDHFRTVILPPSAPLGG